MLDALGAIDDHPLQQWARDRSKTYQELLARKARPPRKRNRKHYRRARGRSEDQGRSGSADIEKLNADEQLVRDDPDKRTQLQEAIRQKSGELALVTGRLRVAVVRYQETQDTISLAQTGVASPLPAVGRADTITGLSEKITAEFLMPLFPRANRSEHHRGRALFASGATGIRCLG